MPRTPLHTVIKSPVRGNVSYTVPAGRLAICTIFKVPDIPEIGDSGSHVRMKWNGNNIFAMDMSNVSRIGPFVFTGGDIVGVTSGPNIGLHGFLWDTSIVTRKTALGQILTSGSSSYTVPAGKYAAFNVFPAENESAGATVEINGVAVGMIEGSPTVSNFTERYGPFMAVAGDVISTYRGATAIKSFINGLLFTA